MEIKLNAVDEIGDGFGNRIHTKNDQGQNSRTDNHQDRTTLQARPTRPRYFMNQFIVTLPNIQADFFHD